ncbi:fibroin heavy chain-like [Perca flavescens]|uniref:fibroin heavy chain-like n=1 Tax=Perca flavescens TaxID=8167 RepID=UPI00106EDDB9|nr:fibroin heavy chain-like [Perca flavescens]XP_028443467.1 fibroin heavy chain-like [Perca flavescens]
MEWTSSVAACSFSRSWLSFSAGWGGSGVAVGQSAGVEVKAGAVWTTLGAGAGAEAGVAAEAEAGAEPGAVFESRAAVASTEARGLFSGTGGGDSEQGTNCGVGVGADAVCVGVEGSSVVPEAGAGPEAEAGAGAGATAGWAVG